tara:strand:+ start:138 stop:656 length:519 start_codon:yes stop_codon:yes gene_type:complete
MSNIKHLSAKTSPAKLSAADEKLIAAARKELSRTDKLLLEIGGLKEAFADAGKSFAEGKLDLLQAATILASSDDRASITGNLRPHVKALQKETVATCSDIILKCRNHAVSELAGKCQNLEAIERASAIELGLSDDDFLPSVLLERIRQQHALALKAASQRVTRADFNQLPAK